jgi:hypothetical protein
MLKYNSFVCFCGIFLLAIFGSCNHIHRKVMSAIDKVHDNNRVAIKLILTDSTPGDSILQDLNGLRMDRYRCKNHLFLFGEAADTAGISKLIFQTGIDLKMKHYDAPMYVFDRQKRCGDSAVTKPWKEYLLMANLVADSAMQQEYMHYHEVQFKEWPEVAQGFCNADFQQLLVFRNGRQLLLVISIPGDKTLDELNPKTEENNPRVVEWNKIMGKYQEGIEGTGPGETWVFLNQIIADSKK